jgi:polysaccharide export outer membrane protein
MKTQPMNKTFTRNRPEESAWPNWLKRLTQLSVLVCAVVIPLSGCRTETPLTGKEMTPYGTVKLREGDTVVISFPGSPGLNATQQIRPDGRIALQLVGEVAAAGKTPAELEKELLNAYDAQLVLKQVSVALQSSAYPVYVTGSVVRPGRILADRPISDLEAIMEAGGFDPAKANMTSVVILRREEGQLKHYVRNLKRLLEGKSSKLFYLKPSDIIYLPERAF